MSLNNPRSLRQRALRRAASRRPLTSAQRLRRRVILAGSILGLMVGAKTMIAQTTVWTNGGADQLWSNTANWSNNGVPDFTADVSFPALVPVGGATSLLDAG